ncbi:hypothetical protein [Streptomyces sp. NPDC029674]|uniref:hypothetical protein n=1 Tax=Streptomyces sp. NPDC029674 TaxID=3365297 RepID=UPI0038504B3C
MPSCPPRGGVRGALRRARLPPAPCGRCRSPCGESPLEQAVTETIKLSGSTAAYAGINPKSTNDDHGREFDRMIIAVAGDEEGAISVNLPSPTLIDKPLSTNWHADPADAVPFGS